MKLPSDSFCILPWVHLYKNMDDGVKLCCTDRGANLGSLKTHTVDEIRNNEEFTKLRKSFLEGEKPKRCEECWTHEKTGYKSYRQSSNGSYEELIKEIKEFKADKPLEIKYLDYRPSNICNLACKICSPRFSTKLIDPWIEAKQLSVEEGLHLTKLNNRRVDVQVISDSIENVDTVYFAGGEPMIAEDHWKLLEDLSNRNPENIKLKYNTNLTHLSFKGKSIADYWPKFRKVMVGASLDGIGLEFDHVRTGGKWENILINLDTIKKLASDVEKQIFEKYNYPKKNMGIELLCESTVGWLNLKSVFKLHKFLVENKYVKLDDPFIPKIQAKPLNYPPGASLENTPDLLKEELLEAVSDYKRWFRSVYEFGPESWESDVDSLSIRIQNANYNEESIIDWLKLNKILDNKYNLNTPEVFKFNNHEWNKKFLELYNYIKLI